jgi:uncharacterized membrane protein YhaH (DUF805 family)
MNLETFIGSLKKYAVFTGRASRREFLNFLIWILIFSFALGVFEGLFFPEYFLVTGQSMLGNLFALVTFIPGIAVDIRRMHDVGKSGWYSLIPIYGLILALTKGDANENRYGPNPENNNNR